MDTVAVSVDDLLHGGYKVMCRKATSEAAKFQVLCVVGHAGKATYRLDMIREYATEAEDVSID